jgi:DNA-binding transcriptional regulator YiaG
MPDDPTTKLYKDLVRQAQANHRELAEYFGVSLKTVYRWWNGETRVPKSAIKVLQLLLKNK